MADVIPRRRGGRSRGQMLLIAAFGVAVMLVALALILNTAIYTENIATRGSDISGGKDALRYRAATQDAFRGTVVRVNQQNNTSDGDFGPLETPVTNSVFNYTNSSGRQQAVDSIVLDIDLKADSPSEGTHAFQRTDRNFSNASGDASWTVANDFQGVRAFSVNVSEPDVDNSTSVGSVSASDEFFFVNVTDRTEAFNIFIYDDGSSGNGIVVQVNDKSGTSLGTCIQEYENMGGESRAVVNITNASVQGQPCPVLKNYWGLVDDPMTMHFNNTCGVTGTLDACLTDTPNIQGKFSFIVNESINETGVNAISDVGGVDPPNATTVVYSLNVQLTYESKRLFYRTDVRVAPGEPDA